MSEEQTKWKREMSAGGVVYKKENDSVFVLMIRHSGRTANKDEFWSFPKGHLNEEKPEVAAVREVREEGGVFAKIVENLGSVEFTFVWEGQNIFKIVTYYLMEYVSGDPKDHDFEIEESRWFPIAEAEKNLKYNGDKEVFERAKKFLVK